MVVPGIPYHVTQRGNRREDVFFSDGDRGPEPQNLWDSHNPLEDAAWESPEVWISKKGEIKW
jgi:REP element-mobilizing transposase RayT